MASPQLESQHETISKSPGEATTAAHFEDTEKSQLDSFNFTEDEKRRLIRRIDLRLVPIVGLMYCVSLIDRTNVAAASIAGMMEDLRLIGNRYILQSFCKRIITDSFALVHMHGINGMGGWRWLFIIEGILTCAIALIGYWLLVDFPDSGRSNWKFLSEHERAWVVARVNADRGDARPTQLNLRKFLFHMLDIKVWGFGLLFFCCSTQGYAMSFFMPIILTSGMGFNRTATQLINITPMLAAAVAMYATGYIGDRFRIRGPLIFFNSVLAIVGMSLMGFHRVVGVRFFGIFLTAAGVNANLPIIMTYQANNIRGQWKRASCSAVLVGLGGVGGIAGSLIFRPSDAPYFRPGLWACISCSLAEILIVLIISIHFYFMNRKADRDGVVLEDEPDSEVPEGERGSFRYTF
ncbi:hypothetical protein FOC1_g10002887 [Fusarium oxysporum f. sp. cubense race 1]|uniref:Major facilitator superfamily (MFS) profile domain-containing protein n=1 Tax=Fusarium oxysporum f. sp. cubense (strain race 1) TaxID=1229664 RepID=N4UU65_FUSC1|nr:hypothetical protein FOC1_g10002887 [Fusarium oxysporum f. sp. cubense race 1]